MIQISTTTRGENSTGSRMSQDGSNLLHAHWVLLTASTPLSRTTGVVAIRAADTTGQHIDWKTRNLVQTNLAKLGRIAGSGRTTRCFCHYKKLATTRRTARSSGLQWSRRRRKTRQGLHAVNVVTGRDPPRVWFSARTQSLEDFLNCEYHCFGGLEITF